MSKNTVQMRLYPTAEQGKRLMGHCQEYISTVNFLVAALDAEILPEKVSTKDFVAPLPSAVKNQALRDAQSVFNRSFELGRLPVLKKPICQWNNQNWKIEEGMLVIPMWLGTHTKQVHLRCADVPLLGEKGLLRIKKKRDKWIADITMTLPETPQTDGTGMMGVDLGINVTQGIKWPSRPRNAVFGILPKWNFPLKSWL
jgi:putative transposase